MTLGRLLLRNLRFHWRGNVAVLLGVAVGTAVLTGALLVGDSLRGSLRELTEGRLGRIQTVLLPGRFFGEKSANNFALRYYQDFLAAGGERSADSSNLQCWPLILLQGSAQSTAGNDDTATVRRAGRVTIWGVKADFLGDAEGHEGKRLFAPMGSEPRSAASDRAPAEERKFWESDQEEVVLTESLARELDVTAGGTITLRLRKASDVPRETLLGRREAGDVVEALRLTVRRVLPADSFGARLSLNPELAAPRNAFVPLRLLQKRLGLVGKVNGLVMGDGWPGQQDALRKVLTLDDWGLVLQTPESRTKTLFEKIDRTPDRQLARSKWRDRIPQALAERADPETGILARETVRDYYQRRGYFSLESRQVLLEDAVAEAARKAAQETGLTAAPTLVYLANDISTAALEIAAAVAALDPAPLAALRVAAPARLRIPYSVVAALDAGLPAPLGPFLPDGTTPLKNDEIILADWSDSPLPVRIGEQVLVTYFEPEQEGRLVERTAAFRLRGVVPLRGVAADPDLTPEFPGITDKVDVRQWDPPFPYDNKRIKTGDVHDRFWKVYRTTPKAYVTLATGQKLWGSRFGRLSGIRLAPAAGADLEKAAAKFQHDLLTELRPEQGGFVFDDVRKRGLEASSGGTDFAMLFLGFSFFLIAAALLLVGLLFRLNLDRRAAEIGLLMALGYRRRTVRRLLWAEGALLAATGGLIGSSGAVLYAWGLLEFLRSWWPGGLDRSFLRLHVTLLSFAIGYGSALLVSVLTIAWAVRVLGKASPRGLLSGETAAESMGTRRQPRWSGWIAGASFLGGLALIACGGWVRDHEARAGTFFSGGFLLLVAGLAGLWALLRRFAGHRTSSPRLRVASLALRNAARHPVRSLLTAGLLASAAFLIVAVESFRRAPDRDFLNKNSGSGGFPLLAEADLPLYQDLNRGPGREELDNALVRARVPQSALDSVSFYPFRLRAGDDASCLNLYQPRRPRLLGVPHSLIDRNGFQFAAAIGKGSNLWALLERTEADGAIPVFGEANTVEWMLKSKLGGIVEVPNERGDLVKLRITGLLQDSVFQGELLMSEANFLKLYPGHQGYNFFLIDAPSEKAEPLKPVLETALADRGFEVTSTTQRLAAFLAVENTYLGTFQMLGGLGLVLGALGLAVVLLRSAWERRGEMALLRALGFRRSVLGWLVLVENGFLLLVGLGVGTGAALLSVAPHVAGGGGEVDWPRLLGLLAVVLFIGLVAGMGAMMATLRAPLVPALRRE